MVAVSQYLRVFKEYLVLCSMRLGLPFIAPRDLGAIWAPLGRLCLPSVHGRTGQSSAPSNSEQCVIAFLVWWRRPLPTSSPMAHRTVWCGLVTVSWAHMAPADRAADFWLSERLAHRTVRWIIATAPWLFPKRILFTGCASLAPDTVWCTPDTLRCTTG
jgi:hypothetical protein